MRYDRRYVNGDWGSETLRIDGFLGHSAILVFFHVLRFFCHSAIPRFSRLLSSFVAVGSSLPQPNRTSSSARALGVLDVGINFSISSFRHYSVSAHRSLDQRMTLLRSTDGTSSINE